MNRRSFLSLLALAPIAAWVSRRYGMSEKPAAVAPRPWDLGGAIGPLNPPGEDTFWRNTADTYDENAIVAGRQWGMTDRRAMLMETDMIESASFSPMDSVEHWAMWDRASGRMVDVPMPKRPS